MAWLRLVQKKFFDQAGETPPAFRLVRHRAKAGFGNAVELRVAIRLGLLPGPFDETALPEPYEGRVERALIEDEPVIRHLLEAVGEGVGVKRPHRMKRPQDNQIERALQQFHGLSRSTRHSSDLPSVLRRALGPRGWRGRRNLQGPPSELLQFLQQVRPLFSNSGLNSTIARLARFLHRAS